MVCTLVLGFVLLGASGAAFAKTHPGFSATRVLAKALDSLPTAIDTSISLARLNVAVSAQRLRLQPIGSTGQTWRSADLAGANSVAEVLDRGGVHVRNYGPSALSSVSVRGGSAAQTLALWNGLPISNPSLGQIDWSLLSLPGAGGAQTVTLTRGGNATLWGSGAVAATVSLDDQATDRRGLSGAVGITGGAFGEQGLSAQIGYGRSQWQSVLSVDVRRADNDFRFRADPSLPEQRQTNAALRQLNVRYDLYRRWDSGDELAFHYWAAATERQIPPTLTQFESVAEQDDGAHRLSLRYRRERRTYSLKTTAGYFAERLDFRDTLAGIDSRSRFDIALADVTVAIPLRYQQSLTVGGTGSYTRARVDDAYEGRPSEASVAVLGSYALAWQNLRVQASARYGRTGELSLGFTPALGLEYRLQPGLTLRARISRDYRAPTFNDRYYRPGGNRDLRAESGYSTELGGDFQKGAWTAGLTGYYRSVEDWILWARQPNQNFFGAYNLAAVTTAGLEPRLGFRKSWGQRTALRINGGYDFVVATNQRAVELPRIDEGQQLWYVPRHSAFGSVDFRQNAWQVRYMHRYRGATLGINDVVAASQTGDVRVQYEGVWQRQGLVAYVEVRNAFDADYQLIERRPLPGRHLRAGVRVTLRGAAPAKPE